MKPNALNDSNANDLNALVAAMHELEDRIDALVAALIGRGAIQHGDFETSLDALQGPLPRERLVVVQKDEEPEHNPLCPYPGLHSPDCDCQGMGGPR